MMGKDDVNMGKAIDELREYLKKHPHEGASFRITDAQAREAICFLCAKIDDLRTEIKAARDRETGFDLFPTYK